MSLVIKGKKAFFESFDLNSRKLALILGFIVVWVVLPAMAADVKDLLQKGDQAFGAKDYTAAMKFYGQAAQQGSASGENDLGYLYAHGLGVQKDYAQALKHYQTSAESGNAAGENNLGQLYSKGFGVSKDDREAFHWHSKAALQGDPEGEYWVGYDYELGKGVKKDLTKAAQWLQESAKAGYRPAEEGLATLYKGGVGVKQDETQSQEWTQKAAEQKILESKLQEPEGQTSQYTYTVKAGDTLWAIARRLFAKGHFWKLILEANKDLISNPSLIRPGQVFSIPATEIGTAQKSS